MKTVTTYCVINTYYGKFHIGTLDEIIRFVFDIKIENRQPTINPKYYKPFKLNSYSEEWTDEEMKKDINKTLLGYLEGGKLAEWRLFYTKQTVFAQ